MFIQMGFFFLHLKRKKKKNPRWELNTHSKENKHSFFFFLPHPQRVEVPGPETKSEPLQWQSQILNPLSHGELPENTHPSSFFCRFFFFFFSPFWVVLWHMEFPGQGLVPSPRCDLRRSCSITRALTRCAGLGMEPTTQCSRDAADPTAPQQELPENTHSWVTSTSFRIALTLVLNASQVIMDVNLPRV